MLVVQTPFCTCQKKTFFCVTHNYRPNKPVAHGCILRFVIGFHGAITNSKLQQKQASRASPSREGRKNVSPAQDLRWTDLQEDIVLRGILLGFFHACSSFDHVELCRAWFKHQQALRLRVRSTQTSKPKHHCCQNNPRCLEGCSCKPWKGSKEAPEFARLLVSDYQILPALTEPSAGQSTAGDTSA